MTPKMNSVFIVAGEPSGDIHAAKLISALKAISPKTKFFGNGGDKWLNLVSKSFTILMICQ